MRKGIMIIKLRKYRQHMTAFVAIVLLALSLRHLSAGINAITGSPNLESWLMAIGIDCAMIAAEVAILSGTTTRWAHTLIVSTLVLSAGFNILAFQARAVGDLGHTLATALGIFVPGAIYGLLQVLGSPKKRTVRRHVKAVIKPKLKAVA